MMKRARKLTRRVTPEDPITKEAFKAWRTKLGWTQFRAADWLRVSLATYENWEYGRRSAADPKRIRRLMRRAKRGLSATRPQDNEPTLFD